MLMQHFQPVAVLAERRIVIYENQIGPYYQVDVTGNEIVNTPVSEEDIDSETPEIQEEESLELSEETAVPEVELTVEPENTELPVPTEEPVVQDEKLETPAEEETGEAIVEPETTEHPVETEVPVETEEPLLDEKIETTEIPELIEIAPIEFKEISSEFVVDLEEGFEFEQAIDEYTSVYSSIDFTVSKNSLASQCTSESDI